MECQYHIKKHAWPRNLLTTLVGVYNQAILVPGYSHYFEGSCDCGAGLFWVDYGNKTGFIVSHFSLAGFHLQRCQKDYLGE